MVLGFGEGAVNIALNKREYSPGETVKGRLLLSLREPKAARELRVELYGETASHEFEVKENRRYVVREVVSGERTYHDGEAFDFSFIVPLNILKKNTNAVKAGAFQKYCGEKPAHWFIQVSLDVPLAFDVNNRIGVKISSRKD